MNNVTIYADCFYDYNTINHGIIVSSISLVAYLLGILKKNEAKMQQSDNVIRISPQLYKSVIVINFFAFLWWLSSLTISDLTGASYIGSGDYSNQTAIYQELLFKVSQYLVFFVIICREQRTNTFLQLIKKIPKIPLILTVIYIMVKLFSGDRGGAIWSLCMLFYVYVWLVRPKIKFVYVLPFLLFFAVLMSAISVGRGYGDQLSFSEKVSMGIREKGVFADQYDSFFIPTQELAHSIQCNHIAYHQILVKKESFFYGQFQGIYLCQMIPILGSKIVESFHIPRKEQSSSAYVTISALGEYPAYGLGTTILADFYLEFGVLGVLLGFYVIGLLFRRIDSIVGNDVKRSTIFLSLCAFVLSSSLVSIPRGYFLFYVRLCMYTYLMFIILNKIFSRYNSNIKK